MNHKKRRKMLIMIQLHMFNSIKLYVVQPVGIQQDDLFYISIFELLNCKMSKDVFNFKIIQEK